VSSLVRHKDPDALTDFRTPALDLDNVYGRGPSDQPYLYDNGPKFLLGELLDNGAPDLPRNSAKIHRALIGDPRNDENSIVSQLQCLFLRFHNRVVDENKALDFRAVQKLVRYHYQWMVVNDFLPRIVHSSVLEELKTDGVYDRGKLKFFHWKNDPFMPVEFSVAGYRLGHSMVRPGYRLNDDDGTLLPIFPPAAGGEGLTGFDSMAKNRGIDWGRFIDVDVRKYGTEQEPADADTKRRLQFAYRIDTSIVGPLGTLPEAVVRDPPPSLAQRNLLRAFELGLPTGQAVARAMRVPVLDDDEIIIGKFVESPEPEDTRGSIASIPDLAPFRGNTPLWTYILAETSYNREDDVIPVTEEITVNTPKLGPVGGRIVAEVFLGLLFGDNESYFTQEPDWTPTIANDFRLREFVNYALGR
jgi:hypothetical protein